MTRKKYTQKRKKPHSKDVGYF